MIDLKNSVIKKDRYGLPLQEIPVSGSSETIELANVIGRMITTIQNSRNQLKQSEEKFRAVFNQAFQFCAIIGTDGTVIDINATALAAAGIDKSEVLGTPFWETPWWNYSEKMQETLKQAVSDAASGTFTRFEAENKIKNDLTICIDFSIKPITDDHNRIFALIAEGRDITEKKNPKSRFVKAGKTCKPFFNPLRMP